MKKTLLFLLLISTLTVKSQTLIGFTINGDSIKTYPVKQKPLSYLTPTEKLFTNAWIAYGSSVSNGYVTIIPDLIGSYPLSYVGKLKPTLTGMPPTFIDSANIAFDNRDSTWFQSKSFPQIAAPYEIWLISRFMPGQRYESRMQGGGNGAYIGDLSTGIRIMDASLTVTGSAMPDNYKTTIERIVVNSNSTADYWANGVKIGSVNTSGLTSYNLIKTFHSIGVFTNSSDFDFAALYFHAGTPFTDAVESTIYASLADKWKAGTIPNHLLPYALNVSKVGSAYAPSISNITDLSKCKVQWYYATGNKYGGLDLSKQILFSTKSSVTASDFPQVYLNMLNFSIKYRIMLSDGWRYFSGTYFNP